MNARRGPAAPGVRAGARGGAPISLDEARRLIAAASTSPALRRNGHAPLTPTHRGLQQARQLREQRHEQLRRLREYKAVLTLLKQRGVRPSPEPRPAARRSGVQTPPSAAAAGFQPLQILAEGDSWFDYPVPLFGGGLIRRLEKRLGVPILNMAEAGDEVRHMLGVEQRRRLIKRLSDGCPAGGSWDLLLFSGGGNDLVDNPMALWIRDWKRGARAEDLLHPQRFAAALELVRAGYEDLIGLRDRLSPTTRLMFHGYDFAIPDGRGVCHRGPWLKPCFDLRGFPDLQSASQVVRAMLVRFAEMLDSLQAHPGVSSVRTQGTLAAKPSAWHNELHPGKAGFEAIADRFQLQIRTLFPQRVL